MHLQELGFTWAYEPEGFVWLPEPRVYNPDFRVLKEDGSFMYIETKGYFKYDDRCKMASVRNQYPDMDLRMVFYKPDKTVSKSPSSMTYMDWADKYNFKWSSFTLPMEWRYECAKKISG